MPKNFIDKLTAGWCTMLGTSYGHSILILLPGSFSG